MASKQKMPVSAKNPVPVKIVSDAPKSTIDYDKKYQAEDDLRTLQRYGELQSNKDRMKAAKGLAKEQMKSLQKACK